MAENAKNDAAALNMTPALLLQCVEALDSLDDKKNSIVGKIRSERQRFKSLGVNLKVLDAIRTLRNADEMDVKADEQDRVRYAQWLGLDLGFQATFEFGAAPGADPDHEANLAKYNATIQGKLAARNGEPRSNNPHEVGTVAHVAFDTGWAMATDEEFENAKPTKPKKAKKGAGPEVTGAVPTAAEPSADQATIQ